MTKQRWLIFILSIALFTSGTFLALRVFRHQDNALPPKQLDIFPERLTFSGGLSKEVHQGAVFSFPIQLENISKPVNAVAVTLQYDPDKLRLVALHGDTSWAEFFLYRNLDYQAGTLQLTGGKAYPGFNQPEGLFARVYFLALEPGETLLTFDSESQVFAADGKGNKLNPERPQTRITILPATTTSPPQVPVPQDSDPVMERWGEKVLLFQQ